jgi:EAL domain-containing protein (putative c-di-GMP-specific phosphodiesterase class I)
MRELTATMVAQSLRACAEWRHSGMPLSVSVNVSARDLNDTGLVDAIAAELKQVDLRPTALTIEITETALMNDLAQASAVVHQLRRLGVGVAVDDFGTGWSSLAHLQRLPVTELKVDRSFVSAARTDPGAAKIVAATISLGQSLGLAAVAEVWRTPRPSPGWRTSAATSRRAGTSDGPCPPATSPTSRAVRRAPARSRAAPDHNGRPDIVTRGS